MSIRRTRLLIWKEFLQLRRDRLLGGLLIAMPILQLIFFGYVIAADISSLRTAIVDLDHSSVSRQVADGFANSEYFNIVAFPESESEVKPLLDRGEVRVVVVIPERTSYRLAQGKSADIGVIVDGSNSQVSQVAGAYATAVVAALNGFEPPASAPSLDARVRVQFNPKMEPVNTMIPGLIAVIMMLSLTAIMSMAVVRERESGVLERLFITPIRPGEYLIGKVTPYAALACVQMAIIALGGSLWFGVPFNGSLLLVLTGLLLFMLISIGLGLLISLVSRTRAQAIQSVLFIMLPSMVLSGFIFPIESMPEQISWVSYLLPLTHALIVMRGSFVKGAGWEAMGQPLLAMVAFAVVIFGFAVFATRKRMVV
ncbi:MAG: ABC transporter permease [Propionibacteriaceae bacterium]|nr:ABC transporter permease [Propionibacteriaceae bacterium]